MSHRNRERKATGVTLSKDAPLDLVDPDPFICTSRAKDAISFERFGD